MSKFFINRPIVAIVIAIFTVIVGAVVVTSLPVAQFPKIAPPEIQVTAIYVGADAQTVEQSVATPIEQQMSGVDNMNYMYSLNSTANGQLRLIVDFDVATDPNTDLILAQSRETQAASQLPADVTNYGVTVQKSVLAPLMLVALNSPKGTYTDRFLANYAYINLTDPSDPRKGRRHGAGIRRRPVRHAPLGEARPTGQAANHRSGDRLGHPDAEHRQSRRAGGQRTDPAGTAVHLLGARAGPSDHAGGVRRYRCSRNARHRHRPRPRRGAGGIRFAGLQLVGPSGWKAERGRRGLPVAGIQCRRHRRGREKAVRRSEEALPRRRRLHHPRGYHAGRERGHQGDRRDPPDRHRSGRSGRVPLPAGLALHARFPCSRCRYRWWARSCSFRSSASASIRSRYSGWCWRSAWWWTTPSW